MKRTDADSLLAELISGTLLTPQLFENLDVEGYLDARDEPAFSDAWMQAYRETVHDPAIMEEETLRGCREQAFKQTFRFTGEHELAAYVSDDFGLIGAFLLQEGDLKPNTNLDPNPNPNLNPTPNSDSNPNQTPIPFAAQLLESYRQGKLPGL
ncbi:hypothetical protein ACE6ED_15210 [Paenibacillus sp. CN-4]|uniref:hypothetical protein n=1 Tax=Paenibacillus nanchangensis TaxID=3348343 RepID=UPI00397AF9C1